MLINFWRWHGVFGKSRIFKKEFIPSNPIIQILGVYPKDIGEMSMYLRPRMFNAVLLIKEKRKS